MNVYSILRFFLPLRNPIGFTLADVLELGMAVFCLAGILWHGRLAGGLRRLAERPVACMAVLAVMPVLLRLALLRHNPVPVPQVSDDFSFLLLGDTLAHFRLANPVHPMHRFFESIFVLQEPSYSSIYPLGQGIVLALGQLLVGEPWAGVAASVGLYCSACFWMLRGWLRPTLAISGALMAVMLFGPLNQWMNNYWGGAVSGIAGCLVFGALPRLWRDVRVRDAAILGAGLGLQVLTRPFEAVLLAICIMPAAYWVPAGSRRRIAVVALVSLVPALALTLAHNKAVTGEWATLPYRLSRQQYGVPAAFTFQAMPEPHRALTAEQELDYRTQKAVHDGLPDSPAEYFARLASRFKFLRFFVFAPMYLVLPFCFPALRRPKSVWLAGCLGIFALGTNFYPYFYPHYVAAVACLLVLSAMVGLDRLAAVRIRGFLVGVDAARILVLLCGAQFLFWYGLRIFGSEDIFIASGPYESWNYVNFGDAEGRVAVARKLAASPSPNLVFVRYSPRHLLREWLQNGADIDHSRTVWALDLGPEEDGALIAYYPGRKVWLLEPDSIPPRLTEVSGP